MVGRPMPRFTYAPFGMSRATRVAICSRLKRFIACASRSAIPSSGRARCGHQPRRGRDLDDTLNEDARGNNALGIEITEIDDLAHLRNGTFCRRGHDRPEIARGLAIDEITPAISAQRLDESEVGTNRVFEHVVPAFDAPRLLAFGERRTVTG